MTRAPFLTVVFAGRARMTLGVGWAVGGVRPRGKRPAGPQIELVFGQAALHERVLEGAEHLLAVAV